MEKQFLISWTQPLPNNFDFDYGRLREKICLTSYVKPQNGRRKGLSHVALSTHATPLVSVFCQSNTTRGRALSVQASHNLIGSSGPFQDGRLKPSTAVSDSRLLRTASVPQIIITIQSYVK